MPARVGLWPQGRGHGTLEIQHTREKIQRFIPRLGAYTRVRRPSLRSEKVAERMEKVVPAMPSDTKKPAPLDPAALAERFQTLAAKS
ncbi:MAG TPA: hypothetical protein VM715_19340 [Candidatus Acidoferrum sp.]|nr:hypothetical protein [Candidatus Acidoferrum sp.]